jgi:hypothetical protein
MHDACREQELISAPWIYLVETKKMASIGNNKSTHASTPADVSSIHDLSTTKGSFGSLKTGEFSCLNPGYLSPV